MAKKIVTKWKCPQCGAINYDAAAETTRPSCGWCKYNAGWDTVRECAVSIFADPT